MKRNFLIALIVTLALIASSCSSALSVDKIQASDLDSFDGACASTEAEAKEAVKVGLDSGAQPSVSLVVANDASGLTSKALPDFSVESKGFAVSEFNGTTNEDGVFVIDWSGTAKEMGTNPTVKASGTFKARSTFTPAKLLSLLTTGSGNLYAKSESDLKLEIGKYEDFNGGKTNFKSLTDITVDINGKTESAVTVKAVAKTSFYMGFSVNATDDHKGGKYIVNLKHAAKFGGNYQEYQGTTKLTADMDYVVTLYDNNNKKVNSWTYTKAEWDAIN